MNYEGPYFAEGFLLNLRPCFAIVLRGISSQPSTMFWYCFAEGFLLNLRPCFDIVFAQLGIIPRTKNKFVEIVAVAECYLITNHVKNIKEAAVLNMPSCKISWWKNVSEKGKTFFALNLQHFSLGKLAGKPFSWKYVEYQLKVKYLGNYVFEKFCYLNDVK